jgi:Zn-dependent protease
MPIDLSRLLIITPPILLALVLHEWAHAWTADRLGDPTARLQGRLSLNPLVHLDPVGTLMLLVTQRFGWARPVPVDVRNLENPRRDLFWIASAGPASNLLQAAGLGGVIRLVGPERMRPGLAFLSGRTPAGITEALLAMVALGFLINIVLAWFNLIPVPPLDGSRLVMRFLPARSLQLYRAAGPWMLAALVAVLFFSPQLLSLILGFPVGRTAYLLGGIRLW